MGRGAAAGAGFDTADHCKVRDEDSCSICCNFTSPSPRFEIRKYRNSILAPLHSPTFSTHQLPCLRARSDRAK